MAFLRHLFLLLLKFAGLLLLLPFLLSFLGFRLWLGLFLYGHSPKVKEGKLLVGFGLCR